MLLACCRRATTCCLVIGLATVPAAAQEWAPAASAPAPAPAAAASQSDLIRSTATRPGSSFSNLFKSTLADFAQIPTRQNLMIAAFGGLVAGASAPHDRQLSQGFAGSRQAGAVFSPGEVLGSASVQFAGAVATQVIGRVIGQPRVAAIGADLLRAQIVTQTLTAGIKLSVQRTRPDGTQYSLPSGHASTTFATATVLQRHLGWKAGVPAYALATYVAASRVQVKRHFLSDVALGATLGIVTGRAVTVGRGETRFAIGPSVVPGGAGVNFTLVGRR